MFLLRPTWVVKSLIEGRRHLPVIDLIRAA
jgi:hypothetical protein